MKAIESANVFWAIARNKENDSLVFSKSHTLSPTLNFQDIIFTYITQLRESIALLQKSLLNTSLSLVIDPKVNHQGDNTKHQEISIFSVVLCIILHSYNC
ncbi:MAG: hypothetical protein PUP93_09780, partial [Rhizonema sp. NSF051]|nr:hypothetical protein [Rhizonema sp. NSF051]